MRGDQRELSGAGSEPSGQGKVFCHLKLNMCNPSSNVFCLAVELMPTMQHHAPPLTSAVTALTDWDWCDEITWLGAGKNISRSARTWNCLPCAELPLWKGQSFDLCVLNPFSLAFINSWHLFARFFFPALWLYMSIKWKRRSKLVVLWAGWCDHLGSVTVGDAGLGGGGRIVAKPAVCACPRVLPSPFPPAQFRPQAESRWQGSISCPCGCIIGSHRGLCGWWGANVFYVDISRLTMCMWLVNALCRCVGATC